MGAQTGRPEGESNDDGYQDDDWPWFHIVQWCMEDAPANCVLKWDLPAILEAAALLTKDVDSFLTRCPNKLPGKHQETFTMEEEAQFGDWAAALLEQSETLKKIRFRCVPQKMSEDVFWSRYFCGLRYIITTQILAPPQDIEYTLSGVRGPFCGGSQEDQCVGLEQYTTKHMEDILWGTLPDDAPVKRRALYLHPHEGVHELRLSFSGPQKIHGFRFMVARRNKARWRIFKDRDDSPFYDGDVLYADGQEKECVVNFPTEVAAEVLRISVDECEFNLGFYSLAFS